MILLHSVKVIFWIQNAFAAITCDYIHIKAAAFFLLVDAAVFFHSSKQLVGGGKISLSNIFA